MDAVTENARDYENEQFSIEQIIYEQAGNGNAQFATAYALMQIAAALSAISMDLTNLRVHLTMDAER